MKKRKKLTLSKETLTSLRSVTGGLLQNEDRPAEPAPDTKAPCLDPETIFY